MVINSIEMKRKTERKLFLIFFCFFSRLQFYLFIFDMLERNKMGVMVYDKKKKREPIQFYGFPVDISTSSLVRSQNSLIL